jgi:hypothetical protein
MRKENYEYIREREEECKGAKENCFYILYIRIS